VLLYADGRIRNELALHLQRLPEGDYYPGLLLVPWPVTFGCGELRSWHLQLYHNDTRLVWTSARKPLRPENAAEKKGVPGEVRLDEPLHLKPGDVLRIHV